MPSRARSRRSTGSFMSAGMKGADALDKALEELGSSMGRRVVGSALKASAKPVVKEARRRAPRGDEPDGKPLWKTIKSGKLNKSQQKKRGKRFGAVEIFVGPTKPTAHLVEFGHVLVKGRKSKGNRRVIGHVPPRPFMRPAWDAKRDEVLAAIEKELWNKLVRTAARLRKQAETGKLSKRSRKALLR